MRSPRVDFFFMGLLYLLIYLRTPPRRRYRCRHPGRTQSRVERRDNVEKTDEGRFRLTNCPTTNQSLPGQESVAFRVTSPGVALAGCRIVLRELCAGLLDLIFPPQDFESRSTVELSPDLHEN